VQVQNTATIQTIQIGVQATGSYQAVIVGADGNKVVVPFVVK
jgi:hypothetical protein